MRLFIAVLTLAAVGCTPMPATDFGRISGTVVVSETEPLPPKSAIEVVLYDGSTGGTVMARQTIDPAPDGRTAFSLPYDPGQIRSEDTVRVEAQVIHEGTPLLASPSPVVIAMEGRRNVRLELPVLTVAPASHPTEPMLADDPGTQAIPKDAGGDGEAAAMRPAVDGPIPLGPAAPPSRPDG